MRKATKATAIAPAMTRASEGSQAPPRSRNASTLLGLLMPERQRPIPNKRPTRKGEMRFMEPSENMADKEDRQKSCAHEYRRRRERARREPCEAADAVSAGAAVGKPCAEADQQSADDQGRGVGLERGGLGSEDGARYERSGDEADPRRRAPRPVACARRNEAAEQARGAEDASLLQDQPGGREPDEKAA